MLIYGWIGYKMMKFSRPKKSIRAGLEKEFLSLCNKFDPRAVRYIGDLFTRILPRLNIFYMGAIKSGPGSLYM